MKIIERDKDQANKKKNVGDYNLKFNIGIGIQILIATHISLLWGEFWNTFQYHF